MPVINVNEDELDLALKLKKDGYTIKEIMEEMNIPVTSQSYNNFRTKIYRHNLKREKGIDYVDKKIEADTETIEDYYENLKRLEESAQLLDTKQTSVELNIPTEKPICIAFWGDWHLGSKGLDYKQFDSDRELIKNTEGLYFIGMGDYKDNNSSYVTRSTNENSICQSMQDLLVTSMMSEVSKKCIALVRGCFLAGTPILMSDGTYKNIEEVNPGDIIISGSGNKREVLTRYNNFYNGKMIKFKVENSSNFIHGTYDHKVLAIKKSDVTNEKKWYNLGELNKDDFIIKLLNEKETKVRIIEREQYDYIGKTYDLNVSEDHTYLVDNLVVHNCHDDWDKKLGDRDFISELCRVTDSVNLWHGGMLNINIGKQTYNIFARHKYKNESGLNTTNAQRNMLNDVGPCDVAALGHKHFPDLQMLDRMNKKVVYLRSGSYKKYDEFGQKLAGYSGKTSVPCVILYPDTHKVLPFQELEDAIIHLNAIRK